MAHDQATKDKLRRLYVFERLSLEIAAGQCGVSFATARRWKASAEKAGDDWERVRAAHTMAGGSLEDIARQLLTDLVLQFKAVSYKVMLRMFFFLMLLRFHFQSKQWVV